jgi:hypothetical protein
LNELLLHLLFVLHPLAEFLLEDGCFRIDTGLLLPLLLLDFTESLGLSFLGGLEFSGLLLVNDLQLSGLSLGLGCLTLLLPLLLF